MRAFTLAALLAFTVCACVDEQHAVLAHPAIDEQHAVVSTAAIAEQPWKCPEASTSVRGVSYARYRLEGCGEDEVYECNFAFTPPRCWRP